MLLLYCHTQDADHINRQACCCLSCWRVGGSMGTIWHEGVRWLPGEAALYTTSEQSSAKGQWVWGDINVGIHLRQKHWPGKILFKRVIWTLNWNQEGKLIWVVLGLFFFNKVFKITQQFLFNILCSLHRINKLHSKEILETQIICSGIIYSPLTRACHCCCKITAWLSTVGSLCLSHSTRVCGSGRSLLKWTGILSQCWVKVS